MKTQLSSPGDLSQSDGDASCKVLQMLPDFSSLFSQSLFSRMAFVRLLREWSFHSRPQAGKPHVGPWIGSATEPYSKLMHQHRGCPLGTGKGERRDGNRFFGLVLDFRMIHAQRRPVLSCFHRKMFSPGIVPRGRACSTAARECCRLLSATPSALNWGHAFTSKGQKPITLSRCCPLTSCKLMM